MSLSAKESAILALLREHGEMTGLQIVHAAVGVSRANVYVILDAMEEKGLVTSRPQDEASGLPRRLYRAVKQREKTGP